MIAITLCPAESADCDKPGLAALSWWAAREGIKEGSMERILQQQLVSSNYLGIVGSLRQRETGSALDGLEESFGNGEDQKQRARERERERASERTCPLACGVCIPKDKHLLWALPFDIIPLVILTRKQQLVLSYAILEQPIRRNDILFGVNTRIVA